MDSYKLFAIKPDKHIKILSKYAKDHHITAVS